MKKQTFIWTIIGILLLIILILWLTAFGGWNRLKGSGGNDSTLGQGTETRTEYEEALYNAAYNEGLNTGREECADSLLVLSSIRSTLACICQKGTTTVVK